MHSTPMQEARPSSAATAAKRWADIGDAHGWGGLGGLAGARRASSFFGSRSRTPGGPGDREGSLVMGFPVDHYRQFPNGLALVTQSGPATDLLALIAAYGLTCDESGVPTRPLESFIRTERDKAGYRTLAIHYHLDPAPAPAPLDDGVIVAVVQTIAGLRRGEATFAQVLATFPSLATGVGSLPIILRMGAVAHEFTQLNGKESMEDLPPAKMRGGIADVLKSLPEPEQGLVRAACLQTPKEGALSSWSQFTAVISTLAYTLDLVPRAQTAVPRPALEAPTARAQDRSRAPPLALRPAPPQAGWTRPQTGLRTDAEPVCFACGTAGHKSYQCPSGPSRPAVPVPSQTPATTTTTGRRFPTTAEAGFVNRHRGGQYSSPNMTPPTVIRAVRLGSEGSSSAPVRVELNGIPFGATPDTGMEGPADVFMGQGAFARFHETGDVPELRGSALFADVNGNVVAAKVFALHVSLPDRRGGPFESTGTVIVPSTDDLEDDTVLLSQALLARAGVNVYDAFDPVPFDDEA